VPFSLDTCSPHINGTILTIQNSSDHRFSSHQGHLLVMGEVREVLQGVQVADHTGAA
jgi:hypothetical protein